MPLDDRDEQRLYKVERSVNRLGNYFYITFALFVVFGIGAGFGWNMFKTANEQLGKYKGEIAVALASIKKEGDAAITKIKESAPGIVAAEMSKPGKILQLVAEPLTNDRSIFYSGESQFISVDQISITPKNANSKLIVSAVGSITIQKKATSQEPHFGGTIDLTCNGKKIAGTSFYATDIAKGLSQVTMAVPFVLEGQYLATNNNPVTFYLRMKSKQHTDVILNFTHSEGSFGPGLLKIIEVAQ